MAPVTIFPTLAGSWPGVSGPLRPLPAETQKYSALTPWSPPGCGGRVGALTSSLWEDGMDRTITTLPQFSALALITPPCTRGLTFTGWHWWRRELAPVYCGETGNQNQERAFPAPPLLPLTDYSTLFPFPKAFLPPLCHWLLPAFLLVFSCIFRFRKESLGIALVC